MKTHIVLDLVYTPDEGQQCFVGTYEECQEFVSIQSDYFMYRIVAMTHEELIIYN